jgi:hypothetical protein
LFICFEPHEQSFSYLAAVASTGDRVISMKFFGARYLDLRRLQNLDSCSLYLIREILLEIRPLVAIKHGKAEVRTRFHFSPKPFY